ncbi:MAG TPA: BTAD domain-containing putative transcriptional regulator [Mycobacteriales bacterium]|nr:BTAD domain-containing putative transcriptional regulator [Mycobacteriales bacterium]
MDIALILLSDVRWRGSVVVGDRPRALLAALAGGDGRPVLDDRLVEIIWGQDAPANATNSLQVLVSRTRAACDTDAIVRDGSAYRLGIRSEEIDCGRLTALVREATATLDRDPAQAARLALEALQTVGDLPPVSEGTDALTMLRRAAAADVAAARTVLARASGRVGDHVQALPELTAAHARRPNDESLLTDLLRSEAVVRGPGAALERYEDYRREMRDRLGVDPGGPLQRVHRELLAQDSPVRSGVRFDATSLVGRDRDVARLRVLLGNSRVVSIVGPGGLGKTRLAHVLAREATQPVVHFVELVGVTADDDVVGEVGSALGVRDSVSSRRVLTPQQRADIRGQIAQRLGQAPSLLVLDNCEQIVGAVAGLVAALVSTCPDLRVLTTTRAPLAIAAEHVYLLDELDAADGARLFRERATAARPGLLLDDTVVRKIVVRLDGLPLAIELAAAKARVMAVEEIDRRLTDRFALLRGGDRSAPDRHQTLLAVIDWSWNLLDQTERRALRRLALFNDGFTLDAADEVLGEGGALDPVQGLVDQSLLSLQDTTAGVRYRMLETVREFGRMQLIDAGEDAQARSARRSWAIAYAQRHGNEVMGVNQFTAIDAVGVEEINLADELRECVAERDRDALVVLLATLGLFWAIRGEHGRLIAISGAVAETVEGWSPPPELTDSARAAMAITLTNAMITRDDRIGPIRDLLVKLGRGEEPRLAGMIQVMLECDPEDPAFEAQLEGVAVDADPATAWVAYQWLSNVRENSGDPHGAVESAERALSLMDSDQGPWGAAILHTQLAQLTTHLGDRRRSVEHINAALPVMRRLGAKDDETQLQALLALCAIADGDLALADQRLARIEHIEGEGVFGGVAIGRIGRAELTLIAGDRAAGLQVYRDAAQQMRDLRWPGVTSTGVEPWVLLGDATALTAHAHHATGGDEAHGWALFQDCRDRVRRLLDSSDPHLDLPILGAALLGLASWSLLREADPAGVAARMLALAERFAYNRTTPSMAWELIAPLAEQRLPGQLDTAVAAYRDRQPRELLDEVRTLVEQLPRGSEVPLVTADGERREDRDHDEPGQ